MKVNKSLILIQQIGQLKVLFLAANNKTPNSNCNKLAMLSCSSVKGCSRVTFVNLNFIEIKMSKVISLVSAASLNYNFL